SRTPSMVELRDSPSPRSSPTCVREKAYQLTHARSLKRAAVTPPLLPMDLALDPGPQPPFRNVAAPEPLQREEELARVQVTTAPSEMQTVRVAHNRHLAVRKSNLVAVSGRALLGRTGERRQYVAVDRLDTRVGHQFVEHECAVALIAVEGV